MFNFTELKSRISEKGYTQKELSKELGISENTFTSKMKGRYFFDTREIVIICNCLDISLRDIYEYFFVLN